ncbi:oleosin 1-like [Neltuma alba]|uniref:oleosin 1-like n=1 Tax=Neltuma alba TaxID=207710 RepID=UPI0010A515A8|nr:oleosin 1-like [Prosopis alba]
MGSSATSHHCSSHSPGQPSFPQFGFRSSAAFPSSATMSDQTGSMSSYPPSNYDSSSPHSRQTVKLFTAATLGLVLLLLSGLTLIGTVTALIIATPLLILFSPILVPAGFALFLLIAGFLFAGGCGVAAIAALSWIYNYVAGKHPPGSDRLDYAGAVIADKARGMKEKAKDYGQYVQGKAQDATQGS